MIGKETRTCSARHHSRRSLLRCRGVHLRVLENLLRRTQTCARCADREREGKEEAWRGRRGRSRKEGGQRVLPMLRRRWGRAVEACEWPAEREDDEQESESGRCSEGRKRKKETKGRTRSWMLWELEGVQDGTRRPTGGSVLRDGRQPGRTARDTTRRT